jgi:hypothetical protein
LTAFTRWRAGLSRQAENGPEQYQPDSNRGAILQVDEIARETRARAFPVRLEML